MSGLLGQQKQLPTTNGQNQDVYSGLLAYLKNNGFGGTTADADPNSPGNQAFLKPYMDMFTKQNATTFAQAKESAGNLTGSGLGNTLGTAAGNAAAGENAFLSNLLEQHNQANASRYSQLVLGALGSPSGQVQNYYQPGILDYAMQGAGTAAKAGLFGGAKT